MNETRLEVLESEISTRLKPRRYLEPPMALSSACDESAEREVSYRGAQDVEKESEFCSNQRENSVCIASE